MSRRCHRHCVLHAQVERNLNRPFVRMSPTVFASLSFWPSSTLWWVTGCFRIGSPCCGSSVESAHKQQTCRRYGASESYPRWWQQDFLSLVSPLELSRTLWGTATVKRHQCGWSRLLCVLQRWPLECLEWGQPKAPREDGKTSFVAVVRRATGTENELVREDLTPSAIFLVGGNNRQSPLTLVVDAGQGTVKLTVLNAKFGLIGAHRVRRRMRKRRKAKRQRGWGPVISVLAESSK